MLYDIFESGMRGIYMALVWITLLPKLNGLRLFGSGEKQGIMNHVVLSYTSLSEMEIFMEVWVLKTYIQWLHLYNAIHCDNSLHDKSSPTARKNETLFVALVYSSIVIVVCIWMKYWNNGIYLQFHSNCRYPSG
ncbi:uncharacterized protein HKW66_Vig0137960 [Vigna angularis]|uniref:Uncharacterized protein n=1 Tax=Phaseolus angularis TaxID=3914 RepID=A0A8T0KEZ2_PHAAN|nr:uncharacterized protein HKW66_Vig0137960 [Vigna angularis]